MSGKKKKVRTKKPKKPKDMPRRPLSAYNLFFREERTRLLEEELNATQHPDGLFSVLGKEIAKRWKALPEDKRQKYKAMAAEELQRYRREMAAYQ